MSGEIHIGFIPTVGPTCCPTSSRICEHFPQAEFYLYEDQTQVLPAGWRRGAGLPRAGGAGRDGGVWRHPLYQEPMWLAVPQHHPEASARRCPCTISRGKKLLMLADGHRLRDQALGFCFAAGIGEDQRFKGTSLETLRNMVAAGSGMTLVPRLAVPANPEEGASAIAR